MARPPADSSEGSSQYSMSGWPIEVQVRPREAMVWLVEVRGWLTRARGWGQGWPRAGQPGPDRTGPAYQSERFWHPIEVMGKVPGCPRSGKDQSLANMAQHTYFTEHKANPKRLRACQTWGQRKSPQQAVSRQNEIMTPTALRIRQVVSSLSSSQALPRRPLEAALPD